jgi:nucleotide-binding universal stress UspA family protein
MSKTAAIVVGVDGSASSMKALGWAVDQAVAEHRPLVLVHALVNPTPSWSDVVIADPEATRAALEAEGRKLLESARDRAVAQAPDLEVELTVEFADPRQLLLRFSKGTAMLVLGSRGRGPVKSLLLGSVGVAVTRHAECPVAIHRPMHPGEVRNGVLVATDASEHARPVLEFAFELASLRRLPLTVMYAQWDVETIARYSHNMPAPDPGPEQLELSEALAGMGEKYPEVRVTRAVVGGPPEATVAKAAARMDVLVVGAHRGSRLEKSIYGSVSTSLVEHASCVVVVVPLRTDGPEPDSD